jgi:hypothetical protein
VEDFTFGGAWRDGYRFVGRGFLVQFLILVVVGILGPLAVQYALVGAPLDGASSPLGSGRAMMQGGDVPLVLLTLALGIVLQAGSAFGALRFGYSGERAPAGAVVFGLGAGFAAMLVVAIGYATAWVLGLALASARAPELAVIILILPVAIVTSLFFLSQVIMAAATIIGMLLYLFVYGIIIGYPEFPTLMFGGSGMLTVVMLLMSILLFWLAARFSCVTALMAERQSLHVFAAIRDSWAMTADQQGAIFRYVTLIGFCIGIIVIGIGLAMGSGLGGLMQQGGSFDPNGTGGFILRLVFGIPLAILSVMLPAGIHRQLVGEETPAEIFE